MLLLTAAFMASAVPTAATASDVLSLMAPLQSRCIWFAGDSVSREIHFHLLLVALSCFEPAYQRSPAFAKVAARVNLKARCKFLSHIMKLRKDRVTFLPLDADPAHDVEVRWYWAPLMRNHLDSTPLLESLDRRDCDAYVLNSGLWHMQSKLELDALRGQSSAFLNALVKGPATRAATARSRVLWRSTAPVERTSGLLRNAAVGFMNIAMERRMGAAGIGVFNPRAAFKGGKSRKTSDGVHPVRTVEVRLVRALLRVLARRLEAEPAMVASGRAAHADRTGANLTEEEAGDVADAVADAARREGKRKWMTSPPPPPPPRAGRKG